MKKTTNNCVFTILSLAEAEFFSEKLRDLKSVWDSCDCILCLLDAEEDALAQFAESTPWKTVSAREYIVHDFLDQAFFFSKDELATVCRIHCLTKLIDLYDVVLSFRPQAFDIAAAFLPADIPQNTIRIPVDRSVPDIDALPGTGCQNEEEPDLVLFSAGEGVKNYLNWCVKKVEYILRFYNGYPFSVSLKHHQWSALHQWLEYAIHFELQVDISYALPHREALKNIPAAYRYDRLSDGTLISPVLRKNYLRNYRLRRRCEGNPFSHVDALLNKSDIIGDRFPIPLTPMMSEIYVSRPDIAAVFGDIRIPANRYAFSTWFLEARGIDNLLQDLDETYFSAIEKARNEHPAGQRLHPDSFRSRLPGRVKRILSNCPGKMNLHKTEKSKQDETLPRGVNLCGFIYGSFGLGEAVRILAEILETGGIPFTIVDYQVGSQVFQETQWAHKVSNEFPYNTNIILTSPDWVPEFMNEIDASIFEGRYNIGYWFWELTEFPEEWLSSFDLVDEVWTASEFSRNVFQRHTEKPVVTVPLSISLPDAVPLTRKDFGLKEDAFLFFMTYDFFSTTARKNPEAAMAAFLKGFPKDENARLLVKISEMRKVASVERIAAIAKESSNIDFIEGVFPKSQLNALIRCCDAVISLHRAEGFGLVPAEAMYLGKPVIMTNWSGNTEFMTNDNCCPVSYKLIEIEDDSPPYAAGYHWADADIDEAAAYMRRLFEDHDYYETISANARETMRTRFSPEAIAAVLRGRLTELKLL